MRKRKKWMVTAAGLMGGLLGAIPVCADAVAETVTETTVTEEYWEEEFTGTEEETREWLEQRENQEKEEEKKEDEVKEEIIIIEEEPRETQSLPEREPAIAAQEEVPEEPEIKQAVREEREEETDLPATDRKPPVIEITGLLPVSDGKKPVCPKISVTDEEMGKEGILVTLDEHSRGRIQTEFSPKRKGSTLSGVLGGISEDGAYRLTVSAEDAAGNQSKVSRFFTVNQAGTRFAPRKTEESDGKKFIRLENPDDLKILSCMVNGQESDYVWQEDGILIDADSWRDDCQVITLETLDRAGNLSVMEPWVICREN